METPQEYPQEQPQETPEEYPRLAEDRCSCGADQWELDADTKVCENGHQDEANDRPDGDLDDQFGSQGRRAVAGKEDSTNVDLIPTSKEAGVLYLLCLQIILRRQVLWLIETQDVDPQLENVCKRLWELRVSKLPWMPRQDLDDSSGSDSDEDSDEDQDSDSDENEDEDEDENEARDESFSSQTDTDSACTTDEEEVEADDTRYKINLRRWGKGWDWSDRDALPVVSDTLAILYLGCVLREEPIRIGDIFQWAKNDQLPYLGAVDLIPPGIRDLLPPWAYRALLYTPAATFKGAELYFNVMALMLGYQKNYGMVFPEMPIARRLLRYIEELALTPAVYMATQDICKRADLGFTFPTERGRDASTLSRLFNKPQSLIQLPEALLVAAMVIAVKYVHPLDKIERFPVDENDPLTLKMDWDTWERTFRPPKDTGLGPPDRLAYEKPNALKIWTMSKDAIADYMTWYKNERASKHQRAHKNLQIEHGRVVMEDLSPVEPSRKPNPVVKERSYQDLAEEQEEQIKTRMKLVHSAMTVVEPRDGDDVLRIGSLYQPLRSPKQAKGVTKRFYQVVAEMSGLGFRYLVDVVYELETILMEKDAEA